MTLGNQGRLQRPVKAAEALTPDAMNHDANFLAESSGVAGTSYAKKLPSRQNRIFISAGGSGR